MEVSKSLSISSTNRALIGYSATSAKLSDPEFSHFLRTCPSDNSPAKLMAQLMKGTMLGSSHLLVCYIRICFGSSGLEKNCCGKILRCACAFCASCLAGHLKWECANVLRGLGDAFSTAGAKAFELAATQSGIEVLTSVAYESGSTDMQAPIKKIMDDKRCLVIVVFGQTQDISSLLLEAHRQHYTGEWIVSENIIGSLDGIVNNMKNHLDEPSIHKLLRGALLSSLHESLQCILYIILMFCLVTHVSII